MTRCLAIIYIAMVELEGERFFFIFYFFKPRLDHLRFTMNTL